MLLFESLYPVLILFCVVHCGDGQAGDGASHFQIDHKSGKLDIMATQTSADIQSNEDYVDLVMKPGETMSSVTEHDTHHDDHEKSNQRHETPREGKQEKIKETEVKDGSMTEANEREEEGKLNGNFNEEWATLFHMPKVNGTGTKKGNGSKTTKDDRKTERETAEEIKEKENRKMVELQNDASNLAKLIEESTRKELSTKKLVDAASSLENKVESLQNDVIANFVNESVGEGKSGRVENGREKNTPKDSSRGRENVQGTRNGTREEIKMIEKASDGNKSEERFAKGGEKGSKDVANCPGKIPKVREKIDCGHTVPKLSKERVGNKTGSNNETNAKTLLADNAMARAKERMANNSGNEFVGGSSKLVEGEGGGAEEKKLSASKASGGNSKAVEGKTNGDKDGDKNEERYNDSEKKVLKPRGKTDDGKLIVPKISGSNGTEIQKNHTSNEKGNGGDNRSGKKGRGNEEQGGRKEKNFSNKEGKGKKVNGGKECKNCQGKIARPGDVDDGKLIVPKIAEGNEASGNFDHHLLENEGVKTGKVDQAESFDLDDDAQEITEDAIYGDLLNSEPQNSDGQEETASKGMVEAPSRGVVNRENVSNEKAEERNSSLSETENTKNETDVSSNDQKTGSSSGVNTTKEINRQDNETGGSEAGESTKVDIPSEDKDRKKDRKDYEKQRAAKKLEPNVEDEDKNLQNRQPTDSKVKEKIHAETRNFTETLKSGKTFSESRKKAVTDKSERKGHAKAANLGKGSSLANATGEREEVNKVETVKEFNDLLNSFLNNSTPEKRKQLLKLTWHDLRKKYARYDKSEKLHSSASSQKGAQTAQNNSNGRRKESLGAPIQNNSNGPRNESLGAVSKATVGKTKQSIKSEDFKATVGRIKEKITLLKELVAFTKTKELKRFKQKGDPYANI